jgi:hypothetical protein
VGGGCVAGLRIVEAMVKVWMLLRNRRWCVEGENGHVSARWGFEDRTGHLLLSITWRSGEMRISTCAVPCGELDRGPRLPQITAPNECVIRSGYVCNDVLPDATLESSSRMMAHCNDEGMFARKSLCGKVNTLVK